MNNKRGILTILPQRKPRWPAMKAAEKAAKKALLTDILKAWIALFNRTLL